MEENQTATYFFRSRLFTYHIMKKINCMQYIFNVFLNQSLGLILGNIYFIKIMACMPLMSVLLKRVMIEVVCVCVCVCVCV